MSKHLADKRQPSSGGRVKAFMQLARAPRGTWHKSRGDSSGLSRLRAFLRIARGQTS